MATVRQTVKARFLAKVALPDENGCMLWLAAIDTTGYGRFSDGNRRLTMAHRFAYELFVGPIPDGKQIDHLCRVRHCVAPDHLEPVTIRENVLRGVGPTAQQAKRTHCPQRHPLAGDNLVPASLARGMRNCRTCARARSAAFNARRRGVAA